MGDLGSIPRLGRSPGEGDGYPVFWPGEFHGLHSPWGHKESGMTEPFSVSQSFSVVKVEDHRGRLRVVVIS